MKIQQILGNGLTGVMKEIVSRSDMTEVDICSRCRRLGLSKKIKYKVLKFGICMNPRGITCYIVYTKDYVFTQYQSKASILY